MADKPTREEAWTILTDYVKSPSLISHALAVEAVMRHVARKRSADEELWGVIGLIHDRMPVILPSGAISPIPSPCVGPP
jgi:predicted hydrolase (HD superfamily)